MALWGVDGSQLVVETAANPGGNSPNSGQVASKALDARLDTKWLDSNFISNGHSLLTLVLPAAALVSRYELFTANDAKYRDPVSWVFGLVRADGTYEPLSWATGFDVPSARQTSFGAHTYVVQPSPPPPRSSCPLVPSPDRCS